MIVFLKNVCIHIITCIIILINNIIKPSVIYFLISFVSVIILILFQVSTDLTINSMDKLTLGLLQNLRDTSILSTILSTIVCFLIGLYYLVEKPTKNVVFVTLSWFLVIIAIFLFTITLVESYKNIVIFNKLIIFYATYFLLLASFLLTMYTKVDWKKIEKVYNMQYLAIDSKFIKKSKIMGKDINI